MVTGSVAVDSIGLVNRVVERSRGGRYRERPSVKRGGAGEIARGELCVTARPWHKGGRARMEKAGAKYPSRKRGRGSVRAAQVELIGGEVGVRVGIFGGIGDALDGTVGEARRGAGG